MPELIDRDALIAEYDRVHVGAPGGARKLMVDAPAVNLWIPVSERLPEYGEEVLICTDDDSIRMASLSSDKSEFFGLEYEFWYKVQNVRAWMPKPDAYKPPEVKQE